MDSSIGMEPACSVPSGVARVGMGTVMPALKDLGWWSMLGRICYVGRTVFIPVLLVLLLGVPAASMVILCRVHAVWLGLPVVRNAQAVHVGPTKASLLFSAHLA